MIVTAWLAACGPDNSPTTPKPIIENPADRVFLNAAVYTVDAARTWAEAVAVRDGRILAVGTDADIENLIGENTAVTDLDGQMFCKNVECFSNSISGDATTDGIKLSDQLMHFFPHRIV